jgi:hypothetical protein
MTNRPLTPDETRVLQKRKDGFEEFYEQMMPTLVDFMKRLELEPSHEVLLQAEVFLPKLSQTLEPMKVEGPEDRIWLITRLGYFVGEYCVQKYSGCWFVNDIVDSSYFGRYVVGQFARLKNQNAMVDPFLVAQEYVDTRHAPLIQLVQEVDSELIRA